MNIMIHPCISSRALLIAGLVALFACATPASAVAEDQTFVSSYAETAEAYVGRWTVKLETPGGWLPFQLNISLRGSKLEAHITNGPEVIQVPAELSERGLLLDFAHYDSRILLRMRDENNPESPRVLSGEWTKTRGPGKEAIVRCIGLKEHAITPENPAAFLGRWGVQFADSEDPAVGVFESSDSRKDTPADSRDQSVLGTFLTTTGDYRYLFGRVSGGELQLSCFDGAHAFLFKARLDDHGKLVGDFWSGNWYHEEWTAQRDATATLPDGFTQTVVTDDRLNELGFPDLDGVTRSLGERSLRGRVTLIEVFGSWCPNCHDEAAYLKELRARYGKQGLQVLGLAFELTGDFQRDALQVRRYCERFDVDYPVLIAGISDKQQASELFPILDRIRSYPTTLFVDRTGRIRAVYTGFSGPATGRAHDQLRTRFEALIERLLAE